MSSLNLRDGLFILFAFCSYITYAQNNLTQSGNELAKFYSKRHNVQISL